MVACARNATVPRHGNAGSETASPTWILLSGCCNVLAWIHSCACATIS